MAMSTGGGGSSEKPMSDINTTPLVDVMLVLLIIFLIAVPVAIQTVKGIVLPKVRFDPTTTKPENVLLSVTSGPDGNCLVYWGTSPITSKDLLTRAVDKLKLEIERQGGAGQPEPRTARSPYPRRRQHALQVHRRHHLHDAAGRLRQGRLHLAAATRGWLICPARPRSI